jgi:hypothetical protein
MAMRSSSRRRSGPRGAGFRTIIEEDVLAGLRTTTTFHQKFPLTSQPERVVVNPIARSGEDGAISKEQYVWRCDRANRANANACVPTIGTPARYFPFLDTKESWTYDAATAAGVRRPVRRPGHPSIRLSRPTSERFPDAGHEHAKPRRVRGLVRYGLATRSWLAVGGDEGIDQAEQLLLGLCRHASMSLSRRSSRVLIAGVAALRLAPMPDPDRRDRGAHRRFVSRRGAVKRRRPGSLAQGVGFPNR